MNINSENCGYCFIDLDISNHRVKLATAAAFVDKTDSRYGFSSKDLRYLGGSEVSRIPELIASDHEWVSKDTECGGVKTRPPIAGNRIVVKLFWDVAPLACENFATLCANGSSFGLCGGKTKPPPVGESGKPLTYRNTVVHRVIPKFVLQAGDFVFGNGSGGESVFGKKTFKDERAGLALKHDRQGILSMGNSGKNSNSSQFFFLLGDSASQCDGKHVIFGELKSGMEVLKAAEQFGTSSGEPTVSIMITDCGIYEPLVTPGSGYWYDKPDEESYLGISPVFMVRPRAVLLGPSQSVLEKFDFAMGSCVSIVAKISKEEVGEIVQQQAATRIIELLGDFSVDVVLIAPACKSMKSLIELPKSWAERGINVAEVVLVAKPVEAMAVIHSKSWLAKRADWQLDGKS